MVVVGDRVGKLVCNCMNKTVGCYIKTISTPARSKYAKKRATSKLKSHIFYGKGTHPIPHPVLDLAIPLKMTSHTSHESAQLTDLSTRKLE